MPIDAMTDGQVADLLRSTRRIAVVGASANPSRPSYGVMGFLIRHGWTVVPVNPGLAGQMVQGRPVVATLDDAGPLDMVDIFRAADQAGAVVDDAIRLGARSVWLQLGVIDHEALARARAAGLIAVMHRCPAIETPRLRLEPIAAPDHVVSANGSFKGET